VTGVLGGIGRATASCFAQAGWRVFGVDIAPGEAPDGVERFWQADLSLPGENASVFDGLGPIVGGCLDALVNNAAIQVVKPLLETTIEDWDRVIGANLRSVFLSTRNAHPLLVASRGAVVNVSSVHALATSTNNVAYAASKGGVLAMTRALAIELAPAGVRVNAILPGAVDTGMLRAGISRSRPDSVEAGLEALAARTVLGRIGTPDEIARAILFLADSGQSSFMTGQALVVDGGATCRLSTE
jgi:NAD(P)-dependent dehydrogenase (short-subunit alcohol dehydrogenase family)